MERIVKPPVDNGEVIVHRVIFKDEETPLDQKIVRRNAFLFYLMSDGIYSGIMSCGPTGFDELTYSWDTDRWVCTLKATERKDG